MVNRITAVRQALESQGVKLLDLISGSPNEHGFIYPPPILKREFDRYFDAQDYRPDPKGDPAAREAIREYYAGEGISFSADQIILTSGTSESFFHLFSLLAGPGETILVPGPTYPLFGEIARLARVRLKTYPLVEGRGWVIDLEALAEAVDGGTRAIVLVSPNNPTGAVHSREEIERVVALANQSNLAVISDEVFSEFFFDPGRFPRVAGVASPDLLFTLNGISKMFALPGLKLGWIGVSGETGRVADAVDRLETMADTFLSTAMPIQKALPAIFREGRGFKKEYAEEVVRRRNLAVEILSRSRNVRFHPPRGGFYLTLEVVSARGLSEEDLVIRLLEEAHVFVHPGYFYDIESGIHLVISVLNRRGELEEGLGRLLDCL